MYDLIIATITLYISAGCDEERGPDLLDDTLEERTADETLLVSEVRRPEITCRSFL